MDPPVSVPIEANDMPATTAAAEPPLEPPADLEESTGFRTGPKADSSLVVPKANSCRLHLPIRTAPASRNRVTTVASRAATCPARTRDAAVVATPLTSIRSLSATGTPCSGPRSRPAARSLSTCLACARASSASTVMNALSFELSRATRARQASVASAADTLPDLMRADSSPIETAGRSALRIARRTRAPLTRGGCTLFSAPLRVFVPVRPAEQRGGVREGPEQRLQIEEAAGLGVSERRLQPGLDLHRLPPELTRGRHSLQFLQSVPKRDLARGRQRL
jgi:hypothetical protein